MKRYELTKEQWERVKAILPPERTGQRGRPRKDDRKMLKWQSVYARFAKWRDDVTLKAVFRALSADADMKNLSLDSICAKVHESANGGKKRRIRQSGEPGAG